MIWIALSFYGLGIIGAVAAVSREAPMGLREWAIVIIWPIAVGAGIGLGLLETVRKAARP